MSDDDYGLRLESGIRNLIADCDNVAALAGERADAAYRVYDLGVAASLQATRLAHQDLAAHLRQLIAPKGDD